MFLEREERFLTHLDNTDMLQLPYTARNSASCPVLFVFGHFGLELCDDCTFLDCAH
jgi:hypothetical protein